MSNNQLDLLKATSQRAIYEEIQFAAFHPSLNGSLRVRINPPRVVAREIAKTFQRINELGDAVLTPEQLKQFRELTVKRDSLIGDEQSALVELERLRVTLLTDENKTEMKELNERAIGYTAQLIPRGTNTDETLTVEELTEFLNGGDDDDAAFEVWLLRTIWEKVGAHFLAASGRAPR